MDGSECLDEALFLCYLLVWVVVLAAFFCVPLLAGDVWKTTRVFRTICELVLCCESALLAVLICVFCVLVEHGFNDITYDGDAGMRM